MVQKGHPRLERLRESSAKVQSQGLPTAGPKFRDSKSAGVRNLRKSREI